MTDCEIIYGFKEEKLQELTNEELILLMLNRIFEINFTPPFLFNNEIKRRIIDKLNQDNIEE